MIANSGALFFEVISDESDGSIQCDLCPHRCRIAKGKSGLCRVRMNNDGRMELPFKGWVSALALDPIEKKPLYHYRPGTTILSVGFVGCNLRCPFCQNWEISQATDAASRSLSPEKLVEAAKVAKSAAIAYTYSEPLIHVEYLLEAMTAARKEGLANVLVTNGCINEGPAREVLGLADAANVDLKTFSEETYTNILGGDLGTAKRFIEIAVELGVHTEVTTLVVPNLNDSQDEMDGCVNFLANLSPELPWHLSAYRPEYRWRTPATRPEKLRSIASRGRTKLHNVYIGNVLGETNDTVCAHCGAILVKRRVYEIDTSGLRYEKKEPDRSYSCAECGAPAPFR